MQRKYIKKNVYNAGKTAANQEVVFQHMCNHYRRILNAKKTVDTSPPYCYKARRSASSLSKANSCIGNNINKKITNSQNTSPSLTARSSNNSCKGSCWGSESYTGSSRYHISCVPDYPGSNPPAKYSCFDMDLVNRITYDTKNGPATYCDEGWMEVKAQHNDVRYKAEKNKSDRETAMNTKRRNQSKSVESQQKRIVLSNQITNENTQELTVGCVTGTTRCKCINICVCDANEEDMNYKKSPENPKEQSQTSSRDSAYNGGVSSLPESRSPTPDQRRKKECQCTAGDGEYFCKKKQAKKEKMEKRSRSNVEDQTEPKESKPPIPPCLPSTTVKDKESLKNKIKEDMLYTKFVQDITVEVLEKCLYTNKALKKVMKRHILNNLKTLDKDRMIKEVENLRKQLGIPEDKNFLDLSLGVVESSTDLAKPYPVILDSEFVMPENFKSQSPVVTKKENTLQDTGKSIDESISIKDPPSKMTEKNGIPFDSDSEEDEIISVIQVAKSLREKRHTENLPKPTAAASPSQGNSADESDLSSENTKSKVQNVRYQTRNYTSYSSTSESEESDLLRKSKLQKDKNSTGENENSSSERSDSNYQSLELPKKSVSFWNNKDLEVNANAEIKPKKFVKKVSEGKWNQSKESIEL